ncbi:hypothetical protein DP939_11905 [Spongiactinospora rosea]|uniref:Uncharacterized protein n=1 Tax=Spongiactinospora rosea TaxID=2248750 RepID=A0A366M4V5_9ACTN|nr:hypothetical protein [Spongiactinospora rosea]RBQ20472.1 hypothetical protein DP939_11905 [Spongiactinospora rosea]
MTAPSHITALNDQLWAATKEANTIIDRFAATACRTPARKVNVPWLDGQARAVARALHTGTALCCPHLDAPTVLHVAAWAPDRVTCSGCIAELRPDPAEDMRCDRCRKPARALHTGLYSAGPIVLQYGLCPRCARRTGLTAHHPTTPA